MLSLRLLLLLLFVGDVGGCAEASDGHCVDHAGPGHGFEKLLDFGGAGDKLMLPEQECGVLDQLDERD